VTERPVGRGVAVYGLCCVLVIGLASGVFVALYGSTADRWAILVSALLALVVQLLAYVLARLVAQSQGGNLIAGWGLGAVICMLVLVVYGFVCRPLGLPPSAALLSLATFFFLTELIEAPLLTI
jgi:hypothetical protein